METKVNEFRIGNYLHDSDNELCRVEALTTHESPHEIYAPRINHPITVLPNKPIPLTEEWLIKSPFELEVNNKDSGYKQYGYRRNGFYIMFCIECNGEPECFIENIGIDIPFVHTLQNVVFALTGEELI